MEKRAFRSRLITLSCSIAVAMSVVSCSPNTIDMSNVVFENQEFVYDGSVKTLELRNLPEEVEYTFTVKNELGNEIRTDEVSLVGTYYFTANFDVPNTYITPDPMSATLTINRADYKMPNFAFEGLDVTYDGEAHIPTVTGVPDEVDYSLHLYDLYSQELPNGAVEAGIYKVVVDFEYDNPNYNEIESQEGYMTIKPEYYDEGGIWIGNLACTYNGNPQSPTVNGLPEGVTYSLTFYKEGETSPTSQAIDAGRYNVVISFNSDSNHYPIKSRTVEFVINKATYNMSKVTVTKTNQNYNGTALSPVVSNLPAGVSASIKYFYGDSVEPLDQAINIGIYRAVISFIGDANHNLIPDKEVQFVIERGVYDMSKFRLDGLEVLYDGKDHLPILVDLPAGVSADVKMYFGKNEVTAVNEIGSYQVHVSFTGDNEYYDAILDRDYTLNVSKGVYDMSNFKFENLEYNYDGNAHKPSITGVPTGVTAEVKLYKVGNDDVSYDEVVEAGNYRAVASFNGDNTYYNEIEDRSASFVISKISKTLDVQAYQRTFNIDNHDREVEIKGDLKGAKAVYSYKDASGNVVDDINQAPVGEYDVEVSFDHPNYVIGNVLHSKLIVTDKIVRNISSYADLVAMAEEAQDNFGLLEASGINSVTGEIDNWSSYNGGNPEDRWANKVTYQLVNDIDCRNQSWKAVGWDIGHGLGVEQTTIDNEEVSVVKDTNKIVNVPRTEGLTEYGFGYVSLYLDGNGHSIKNFKLDNNTHSLANDADCYSDELGKYPTFLSTSLETGFYSDDYRRVGMFISTSYSTFKNIVFENPVMDIDDTSSSITRAGFINASEGYANTYENLTFLYPTINVNASSASVGGIAGTTLVLSRDTNPAGVCGADFYLDNKEEMEFNLTNIKMTGIDFNSSCNGGSNSLGGLYGDNQTGWWTFNLDNVDIDGSIAMNNDNTKNYTGDFFGLIELGYTSRGVYSKDPDAYYSFNINNCDTNITYYLSDGSNMGTGIEGDSYHQITLSENDYVPNKYYRIIPGTATFELCTGTYDANEYYFEKGYEVVELTSETYALNTYYVLDDNGCYELSSEDFDADTVYYQVEKELFDSNYFFITYLDNPSLVNDKVGILNDKISVTNSVCNSGFDATDYINAIKLENVSVDYDGLEHTLLATGVSTNVAVEYQNNVQIDSGDYVVTANFSVMSSSGFRTLAKFTKTAILSIKPVVVNLADVVSFGNTTKQYNGYYQELTFESAPSWVEVEYYENNVRREIGSQTVTAYVKTEDNPNYIFLDNKVVTTFTIEPYEYDVDNDTDTLIAVATADKIQLTAKNLGTEGTAQVVYFHSYEYFEINELSGVSTNQSYGTVVEGQIYNCGTLQTLVFDRYSSTWYDLVYCKFSLRTGSSESDYALLHNPVYCKDIEAQYDYDYNLRNQIKGIDYPPLSPTDNINDALAKDANFCTFNMLLCNMVMPNEIVDAYGNTSSNIGNLDMSNAIVHQVNGQTYYMYKSYFETYLDPCVQKCKENNVKLIGIFYNHNFTDVYANPYYATYPDARDTGSMAQFALNTSNYFGEGYVIACIDFIMQRYSGDGINIFKDIIVGNELELCQKWYPIQTYAGQQIYSALKFSAEYIRTLRLVYNTIRKYIPDGNAYAPFSRYMTRTTISKDSVYSIQSLLTSISYISKLEGDFDWGVTIHPYDHSHPYDIVYSVSVRSSEFNATFDSQGLTYPNIEVIDRYLKQSDFLYNGTNLRRVILDECGIYTNTTNATNKAYALASLAFAYYRCACLDSIYALCMSTYGIYNMIDEAAALWKDIDKPGTFEMTQDMFKNLNIFDRVGKKKYNAAEFLGADDWQSFMDIWNDPNVDWDTLWNEYKIIQNYN